MATMDRKDSLSFFTIRNALPLQCSDSNQSIAPTQSEKNGNNVIMMVSDERPGEWRAGGATSPPLAVQYST